MAERRQSVEEVVARILAGLPPTPTATFTCRDCRAHTASDQPGSADGYCALCAAERRRSGRWQTPPLV